MSPNSVASAVSPSKKFLEVSLSSPNITRRQICKLLPLCGIAALGRHTGLSQQLVTGVSRLSPAASKLSSKLALRSSSQQFVDVFQWARSQALAFAFDNGDPVGPWYEAVEPGREGFCIRDTCHQSLGAHALGLASFNANMLRKFAENISDSKDWCSYWEINRYNRPAPVDYEDDAEFWYNLPSNFDLLDCCYRMYVWSGDETYIHDPVFLNFYDRTVNDYVERWGLDIDHIMSRPRLLNVRGIPNPAKKFTKARGIPGYDERDHSYIVGLDVLQTQHAAYLAYAHLQQARKEAQLAEDFVKKAAAIEELLQIQWWDKNQHCFSSRLEPDHQMAPCSTRRNSSKELVWRSDVIAGISELKIEPDQDAAMEGLLDLSHARLEYPEVSYTRIGDIVHSAMGVTLEYLSPLLSTSVGDWVEVTVTTLSGLGSNIAWAQLENLPIRSNEVSLRHEGGTKSVLTNQAGPSLIWRPVFEGSHETIWANGRPVKATVGKDKGGNLFSYIRAAVGSGDNVEAKLPV